MARARVLKRKTFFVDERALARARKALGAATDAQAIQLSVERMAEMEESQGKIVRDQPDRARAGGPRQSFMRLAGSVRGPRALSSRKGFSRS